MLKIKNEIYTGEVEFCDNKNCRFNVNYRSGCSLGNVCFTLPSRSKKPHCISKEEKMDKTTIPEKMELEIILDESLSVGVE